MGLAQVGAVLVQEGGDEVVVGLLVRVLLQELLEAAARFP